MISIDNYDFKGKRAIIRVDFNVPLNEKGEVTDETRIRAAIPTIKKVLAGGGSVLLMSHMGRPKKNPDPKYSLEQIVPAIEKNLGTRSNSPATAWVRRPPKWPRTSSPDR